MSRSDERARSGLYSRMPPRPRLRRSPSVKSAGARRRNSRRSTPRPMHHHAYQPSPEHALERPGHGPAQLLGDADHLTGSAQGLELRWPRANASFRLLAFRPGAASRGDGITPPPHRALGDAAKSSAARCVPAESPKFASAGDADCFGTGLQGNAGDVTARKVKPIELARELIRRHDATSDRVAAL
jgi:hypothetical protein